MYDTLSEVAVTAKSPQRRVRLKHYSAICPLLQKTPYPNNGFG